MPACVLAGHFSIFLNELLENRLSRIILYGWGDSIFGKSRVDLAQSPDQVGDRFLLRISRTEIKTEIVTIEFCLDKG